MAAEKIVGLAQAIPESSYDWRPAEGVRDADGGATAFPFGSLDALVAYWGAWYAFFPQTSVWGPAGKPGVSEPS